VAALARELEKTINQGEQLKLRQQPGYRPAAVSIGVDERTPALILAGSPELFATVKELVTKLQTFRGEERPVTARIVPVKNMPAQDLKRVIQQMIEQQQGQGSGQQRRR
jgi:type II secretory pathway component GspD/PulD (secretin)